MDQLELNKFPKYLVKNCKDCHKDKPCKWQSSFTSSGKPEYRARCNDCFGIYLKKIRSKDSYKKSRNVKKRILAKKRKKFAVDYLGGKCQICSYDKCLGALTFHHRNPKDKKFTVGNLLDYSLKVLKTELDKCDLLCFNCHMELEHSDPQNESI